MTISLAMPARRWPAAGRRASTRQGSQKQRKRFPYAVVDHAPAFHCFGIRIGICAVSPSGASRHVPENIIDLKDVHLTLHSRAGSVQILRGVDLASRAGETVGVVGPSGSGKSTLLMIMTGLEKASSGSVRVAGHDFMALGEDGLARVRGENIGIVFQSFHLVPTMTALENVALPLEFLGRADARRARRRGAAAVGLAHRLEPFPGAAFRRRAAARRHRPRAGAQSEDPVRRRADRQSRRARTASRSWTCCSACISASARRWCSSPMTSGWRRVAAASSPWRTAASARSGAGLESVA